jgi:hypothetical protein
MEGKCWIGNGDGKKCSKVLKVKGKGEKKNNLSLKEKMTKREKK